MREFTDLVVWQKAHELTLSVYQATYSFPREEIYGLTSQIRRAAASVPANIAEGHGRFGDGEFHRFCTIALGSLCELEYHLILAHDLGLLPDHDSFQQRVRSVKALLHGFMRHLSRSHPLRAASREP
jgi:four helix bundle protein